MGDWWRVQVASEDTAAIKRLEADIKAAQRDLEPISKKLAPLQAKAAALEQRIEDAGGPPLKKQRQKVSQLQQVSSMLIQQFPLLVQMLRS